MSVHICIKETLTFKHAEAYNLHVAIATQKSEVRKATFAGKACLVAASSGKLNLSKAQEEFLLWCRALGYYDISETQKLLAGEGMENQPLLIAKLPGVSVWNAPLCRSCLRGKGKINSL